MLLCKGQAGMVLCGCFVAAGLFGAFQEVEGGLLDPRLSSLPERRKELGLHLPQNPVGSPLADRAPQR